MSQKSIPCNMARIISDGFLQEVEQLRSEHDILFPNCLDNHMFNFSAWGIFHYKPKTVLTLFPMGQAIQKGCQNVIMQE